MGSSKRYYEEDENELYDFNTTELICAHHIKDVFIRNYILEKGGKGKCNYCGNKRKVIELSEVLKLIVVGINYYFEDPINSRYINHDSEFGYDGNIMIFDGMIYDLDIQIDDTELFNDIFKYLDNDSLYCLKDEYTSESEYYQETWENFKSVVKHKARYVFHFKNQFSGFNLGEPIEALEKVQNSIINFNLFRTIPITEKLYRCRQHETRDIIDVLGKEIASNLTEKCKTNNRMSPAGISMFYCSPHKEVSISEVVNFTDITKPFYTTACFTPKNKIKLVDLTALPDFPSAFDEANNGHIETLQFLIDFVKDISKPIDNSYGIIDYVPTQIVTEYLRFNPKLKIDGLVYPSSKFSNKENYVLFMDHDESLEHLKFYPKSIKINRIQ